jgi:hypothetical protein
MSKGIRSAVNAIFLELSHKRIAGELGDIRSGTLSAGNVAFRSTVMQFATNTFGINNASAATAYNHAFKMAKEHYPTLVEGLGRSDDKKGGRKAKIITTENEMNSLPHATEPAVTILEQLYDVVRLKDNELVASGVTAETGNELVEKAVRGKKAKLKLVAQ